MCSITQTCTCKYTIHSMYMLHIYMCNIQYTCKCMNAYSMHVVVVYRHVSVYISMHANPIVC